MTARQQPFLSGLLIVVLVIADVASAPSPPTRAALQAESAGHVVAVDTRDFYESPTFGYVVDWYPAAGHWRVQTDRSAGGSDELVLDGDPGRIVFDGYQRYGGDASACLADAAGQVQRSAGISGFGQAIFQDDSSAAAGGVDPYRLNGPTRAADVYTLVSTDAQGRATSLALALECRTLVPAAAVLLVSYLTTPDRYNDFTLSSEADALKVTLPRRAFAPDAAGRLVAHGELNSDYAPCTVPERPRRLTDTAGHELGIATDEGYQDPDSVLVLVENTGSQPLDAGHLPFVFVFTFFDGAPGQPPRASAAVDLPSARGSSALLAPGQRAVVRLAFSSPPNSQGLTGFLLYVPRTGQALVVGSGLGGGCGAGGRPRIATGT